MRDDGNTDLGKSIEKLDLIECNICGYHYQKTKKCPQCSIKEVNQANAISVDNLVVNKNNGSVGLSNIIKN